MTVLPSLSFSVEMTAPSRRPGAAPGHLKRPSVGGEFVVGEFAHADGRSVAPDGEVVCAPPCVSFYQVKKAWLCQPCTRAGVASFPRARKGYVGN